MLALCKLNLCVANVIKKKKKFNKEAIMYILLELVLIFLLTSCGTADYDTPEVIQKILPGEHAIIVNTSHPHINWGIREVFKSQGRARVVANLASDTQINTLRADDFASKFDTDEVLGMTVLSKIPGVNLHNTTQIFIKVPEETDASRTYIGLILAHEMRHAMGEEEHAPCIEGKINYFYPRIATSPNASDSHVMSRITIQSLFHGDQAGYLDLKTAFSLAGVPLTPYLYSLFSCDRQY